MAPFDCNCLRSRYGRESGGHISQPDHPVLNTKQNHHADFDGWMQERGIYFPNQWDEHFTPILAFNDPGSRLEGGLLSQYGKGYFVYTGLVFFRELPPA
jgi:hypothetical protein